MQTACMSSKVHRLAKQGGCALIPVIEEHTCLTGKTTNQSVASPQCPEHTVEDGPHADVPAVHVKCHQYGTPSELSRHVCTQDAEKHDHNVQHDTLQKARKNVDM